MKQSVRDAFVWFTSPLEGVVHFMYLDVKGLVTTAIGILIDPSAVALTLPWFRPDGIPASQAEIAKEWIYVKSRQDLKLQGGMAYGRITKLRLTDNGIKNTVNRKLDSMDSTLNNRFPNYDEWPADAQLATLSVAWACGPMFNFPKLAAALRECDFATAAIECKISEVGNPGIKPRNKANKLLYQNAAYVWDNAVDTEPLYYPKNFE